ncbi:MAG: GGDEF domain-containing protein [Burkholderiales bacterium PBB2]|nr:MAG: GGDEF domain-containing protein [Burkholderiales bacterium PBB2]
MSEAAAAAILSELRLYEQEAVLAELRAQLDRPALPPAERCALRVALAWHERERDTPQALARAEAAEQAMADTPELPEATRAALQRRLRLTRLDALRLYTRYAEGLFEARVLRAEAEAAQDWLACADVAWLQAQLHSGGGQMAASCAALEQAIARAEQAGDRTRQWIFECSLARSAGLQNREAAELRWGQHFPSELSGLHVSAAVLIELYQGYRALRARDLKLAVRRFSSLIQPLQDAGYVRETINTLGNLGSAFNDLNDPESALEWMERGLQMARASGWSASLGSCLMQMGETLRRLGRLELARSLLDEGTQIFAPQPDSRNYAVCLSYQGLLALDLGEGQKALDYFEALQRHPGGYLDLQRNARRGHARALLLLGQGEAAEQMAREDLAVAELSGAAEAEVELRMVLAQIAQRAPGAAGQAQAVQLLELARERAKSIAGYKDSAELLTALALAYAGTGRYREAFETSQQAASARASMLSRSSADRVEALQLHHLNENARTEAQHLQQLAEAERQRAALMQRNSSTLEKLGQIGLELTRHLDTASIFAALSRHIPALLDARGFEIYLLDDEGEGINSVFGLEDGQPLPPDHIALDNPSSNAARCARERRELSIQLAEDGSDPSQVPGTMRTLSAMFAPLLIQERLLGVVTVQSPQAQAYGEHERMIFRSLNAFAAIALDNAIAYRRLQQAQSQLVAQEKLAALGALVAGIAHELNTPLGNSLLMASTLDQRTQEIERAAASKELRRSELEAYLGETRSVARLIMQGLETAAELITSFKQVAVDRTAEQRRLFDLAVLCEQVTATLQASIRKQGHKLELDVPEGILLNSFPGPLGQVLSNLVNNAMLHGFGARRGGLMRLSARLLKDGRAELRFRDDGVGISPAHAGRIFEPFFTTKFGQGGSGLGLSISHNIVSSLLGGSLALDPMPGPGCCFVLCLPLQAPEAQRPADADAGDAAAAI